jgi:hypothetical protein
MANEKVEMQSNVAELRVYNPPVYGLWTGPKDSPAAHHWLLINGAPFHTQFKNAAAAMMLEKGGEVAEIGPDGNPIWIDNVQGGNVPLAAKSAPFTSPASVFTPNTLPAGKIGVP